MYSPIFFIRFLLIIGFICILAVGFIAIVIWKIIKYLTVKILDRLENIYILNKLDLIIIYLFYQLLSVCFLMFYPDYVEFIIIFSSHYIDDNLVYMNNPWTPNDGVNSLGTTNTSSPTPQQQPPGITGIEGYQSTNENNRDNMQVNSTPAPSEFEQTNLRLKTCLLENRKNLQDNGVPFNLPEGETDVNCLSNGRLASLSGAAEFVGNKYEVKEGDRLNNIGILLERSKEIRDFIYSSLGDTFNEQMLDKLKYSDVLSLDDRNLVDSFARNNMGRKNPIGRSTLVSGKVIQELLKVNGQ